MVKAWYIKVSDESVIIQRQVSHICMDILSRKLHNLRFLCNLYPCNLCAITESFRSPSGGTESENIKCEGLTKVAHKQTDRLSYSAKVIEA